LREQSSNDFDTVVKKEVIVKLRVKLRAVFILVILNIGFVACSAPIMQESDAVTNGNQILLSSMPEADIYLYADAQRAENGLYEELILHSGKTGKRFMWENTTNETWLPVLLLEDLTNDGKNELIVKLVRATGTGTHLEDVHILDANNLNEFEIQSLNDIINANVQVGTHENAYEIKTGDEIFLIDKATFDSSMQHLFNTPGFHGIAGFEIKDSKLFATVLLQVSPTEFGGEFVIEYIYQNHAFIMKSIVFARL
jgi:hypothetical protein